MPERDEHAGDLVRDMAGRLLKVEAVTAANAAAIRTMDGEVHSLRRDRHDHANQLTAAELEIELLKQSLSEGHSVRIGKIETTLKEHDGSINKLASDMRLAFWKIGTVTAVGAALLNKALDYVKF